jgi:thiamine transport system ATP-binding protein
VPGLSITDLSVRYGALVAVDDVSLELPQGEVLAVLGASGCGKSTLLRAVAGLEPPTAGTIAFDGDDLAGVPTHRRGFALMFQDGQLFNHQSVAANVGYPLRIRHRPRGRVAERVTELLELVGLAGYGDRAPATLSGGERQRVALARALAVEPRLLLLDEPLSALDASLRERLAGDLREILTRAGTTALLVTHDHEEAFAVADRMALMRDGRLVQSGTPAEVWAHPVDADAAAFLGYASVLDGERAAVVLTAAGLTAAGAPPAGQVALRRSALRVEPSGALAGTVLAARATPEATRLVVDVTGVGVVEAVAPATGPAPGPGEHVRLAVERSRLAAIPLG